MIALAAASTRENSQAPATGAEPVGITVVAGDESVERVPRPATAPTDAATDSSTPPDTVDEPVTVPRKTPDAVSLDRPSDTLGSRSYGALLAGDNGNRLLSPASVEIAVGLVGEAASVEWKADIAEFLGLSYDALAAIDDAAVSDKVRLNLANAIWLPDGFAPTPRYKSRLTDDYGSTVNTLDFGAADAVETVNGWVAEKTDGAIPRILEQLSGRTTMLITNAFYFTGGWLRPFSVDNTRNRPFTKLDGGTADVPMMERTDTFQYARTEHGQVVRLFYEDTDISLILYLPDADADIADANEEAVTWLFATETQDAARPSEGTVVLPRFVMEADMDLTQLLATLGLDSLFGNTAVIQEIEGPSAPALTQIVQRTRIEIDEEGTTAAAATAVVGLRSVKIDQFEFVADHPFHLALHQRGVPTPLLVGYVADPSNLQGEK